MTPTEAESMVLEALSQRLATFVHAPALPVLRTGDVQTPPADKRYIEVQLLMNDTERRFIGSDGPHRHYGIYQLTVVWPRGDSELYPRQVAAKLATHFRADTKMVYSNIMVRSLKRPTVASTMLDDATTRTPVTVEFESYI